MMEYSWDTIQQHNTKESNWIVINNLVYDITKFQKIHPGGLCKIIKIKIL